MNKQSQKKIKLRNGKSENLSFKIMLGAILWKTMSDFLLLA